MSKYEKRAFQLGTHWIGRRENSPSFYRLWMEGGRLRKASLGTTDEQEAKEKLTAWFLAQQQGKPVSKSYSLSEVLLAYHEARGQHTAKPDSVTTSGRYWLEHLGDIPADKAAEVESSAMVREALLEAGKSPAYVNRILGVGKAALMRAYKRRMIPHVPVIEMCGGVESEPLGRPMSVGELQEFYQAIRAEHVRRYFILGLATGARNSAILELDWSQVGPFEIRLNPPGRKQTKKRRPVVPICWGLGEYLSVWKQGQTSGPVVEFWGQHVQCIKTAWRATRRRAGLDKDCTPYSLRHTVGRWLRSQSVPKWEVEALLGHRGGGSSVTERYAHCDPTHMEASKSALDLLLRAVICNDMSQGTTQKLTSRFVLAC